MAFLPKRVKFRKAHRGKMRGRASRGNYLSFGDYGLQSLEPGWLKGTQLEAARKAVTHFLKRGGKIWVRVFPDKPVTAKPAETRMGSGKGLPEFWVAVVRPGTIILELGGVDLATATEALRLASHKMPVRTRFVAKEKVA